MNKKKIIIIILIGLMVGVFFNFGLAYKKITVNNQSWQENFGSIFASGTGEIKNLIDEQEMPIPPKEPDRLDFLLLGIRGEDDPDGGLLTDSIMIISLDQKTGKVSVISLPRDIYVNIRNVFAGKINEIYPVGLAFGREFSYTKETFSRITGVYIDHVAIVNFEAFITIIDEMGGVDIVLNEPFEESLQWGYTFYLPEGKNTLTSEDALYYVRSRYSTNDFDRARRQQQVLMAIKEKAMTLGFLANPIKLHNFASTFGNSVRSDAGIWDIPNLLDLAKSLNAIDRTPKQYVLSTQNVLYDTTESGLYILLPNLNDYKEIQKVFREILD